MGKIFLKRGSEDPFRPYIIETDRRNYVPKEELGEVVILLPTEKGQYVFGLSDKDSYAVHMVFGVTTSEKDLTDKVYEYSKKYCKKLIRSLPEKFDFIDKTGGAKKIELMVLGKTD